MANFYLNPYDISMRDLEEDIPFSYVRFADDQVFMFKDRSHAPYVLNQASIELHKIGLNLNSGKVEEFQSLQDFDYYWCFDIIDNLRDKNLHEAIQEGAILFRRRVKSKDRRLWRYHTILQRLLTTGPGILRGTGRKFLVSEALKQENFDLLDSRQMQNLYKLLSSNREREEFFRNIEVTVDGTLFTSRLLNIRAFYGEEITDSMKNRIEKRLGEIRPDT